MGEHMHNLTAFNQSPTSNSTVIQPERLQQTVEPVRYTINLPPCDTEIFHGDVLQWPSFRDLFAAIYGNNPRLSPVEKLFHLNQKTRGEAKAIVSKAPLTNDGFALAWNNLLCRYENKRVLVNTQLNLLFKLPHISTESETELRNLQREINSCISALQIHGINTDSWDAIFTYLCSIRLPDYTLSLWEQSLDSDSEIPKWVELDKFLTKRVKTLERVSNLKGELSTQPNIKSADGEGRIPTLQSRIGSRPINSHHAKTNNTRCKLCSSQSHILKTCQRFIEMQPNARLNAVRKLHVCLNCLSDSHEVKNCKSMFNCNKCKQRHHSMIHRDQSEGIAQISDTTEISTKSHVASIKANISNVPTSRNMLLGTAMVTICHNESTFTVRALIDSGSEATFVSNSLQKRLHLATKKVSARVSGLNNTVSGQVQSVCSISIGSPRNKGLKLEAEALVLPKLTGLLPSRSINSSILKRLPNIPLADNNFHTSQKVDLLIGADLYPKIILNVVKLKISGSLVAQRTVFGWIITGSVPSEETKKQHQQKHQLQRDQTNDDGETNDAPGSSNHTDTHGSVGVPTLPAAALSLSATSVGSTPPSSAEATNINNFAYYTGAAETVAATAVTAATHRHADAATPPLPPPSQSLPPSSAVAAPTATAHYPPSHQQMLLQLQQQYEQRYQLQTAYYHQQQQAPPSQSQQEDQSATCVTSQQPSTQYQHAAATTTTVNQHAARSNRQATQSTATHHTTNTSQAATTTQQQQPAAMAHALTQTTQQQQQSCQRTSAVTQSTDQRRLSRIPHAQDRARLESSRRLRHAGNFLSDWRHGNDRLRLDSSQRHCPDRTRLDSSRRPPHLQRRRERGSAGAI
ncbi:uncharacterized protein LOC125779271 [Bactrocera dorsalis]|uniref:Uncharacterized protein LOC125779271 n=1 Tax=Bactrocera dorsalis TaxID=27457 RepID=A0ABM3K4B7_BACDO|nr:uncharacterized protein LOC125779271 [Bactrocera dorsalis]